MKHEYRINKWENTSASKVLLESTVKRWNGIERKVIEYYPIKFDYWGKHKEAIKY